LISNLHFTSSLVLRFSLAFFRILASLLWRFLDIPFGN
jgi:hypothetical protein